MIEAPQALPLPEARDKRFGENVARRKLSGSKNPTTPAVVRSSNRIACSVDERGAAATGLNAVMAREQGNRVFFSQRSV